MKCEIDLPGTQRGPQNKIRSVDTARKVGGKYMQSIITACCFAALLSHNIFLNTFINLILMLRGASGGFYQNLDGKQATKYVFPNRAN